MEPLYVVLIAFCVVVSEAKLFIGDCSYGFCEQNCKQIKEHEMECYCKRGFALKNDGRKCIKTFVTDDELSSGDDASGEAGNCDNEDGNCDKTSTEIIVISGDGDDDEGSGAGLSSIIVQVGVSKSTVKAISSITPDVVPSLEKTVSPAIKVVPVTTTTIEKPVRKLVTTQKLAVPTSTLVHRIYTTTKIPIVKKIDTIHPTVKTRSTKKIQPIHPIISSLKVSSIKTIEVIQPVIPTTKISRIKTIEFVQPIIPTSKVSSIKTIDAIRPILPTSKVSTIKTVDAIQPILPTSKVSIITTVDAIPRIIPSSIVSSIKTIDSIHPSSTNIKQIQTISKRPPVLKETVRPSDKNEITTSSVHVASSKHHVTGTRGSPVVPFQPPHPFAKSSVVQTSPKPSVESVKTVGERPLKTVRERPLKTVRGRPSLSSMHSQSQQVVIHTKSVKAIPVRPTSVLKKSASTSISKSVSILVYKGVVSSTTSADIADKSTSIHDKRRKSTTEKLMSTIYVGPPIEYPVVSSTMTVKQPYVRVAANISVSVPAASSTAGFVHIKKYVVQDGEVDTDSLPLRPDPYNRSRYVTPPKVLVDRMPPGVTMATYGVVTTARVQGPGKGTVGIDQTAGPSRSTSAKKVETEKHVATKVVVLTGASKTVGEKLYKPGSSSLAKIPVYKSKIYSVDKTVVSTATIKDIGILPVKTIKTSMSSITTTSSSYSVSSSVEDAKKTTPLGVARTPTVITSRFIDLPVRKSTAEEIVTTTGLHVKGRDIPTSTRSIKTLVSPSRSLSKDDAKKRTEVLSESAATSSRVLRKVSSTASVRSSETERSDEVSITRSSPTTRVTETTPPPRVVVIQDKSQSRGCTLLVNSYLLTVGTCFIIYFLSFYQK